MESSTSAAFSVLRTLTIGFLVLYVFHILRRKYIDRRFNMKGELASWWSPFGVELTVYQMSKVYKPGEALLKFLTQLCSQFQQYTIFHCWIFSVPFVVVNKPESAELFLSSNTYIEKSPFYELLHSWLGLGLLTSGGQRWRTHRKMITPAFHFRILEDFVEIFNEQALILADRLKAYAQTGQAFDVAHEVTSCTLDIICETAMGVSVNAQKNPDSKYVKAIYTVGESFVERIYSPWKWPQMLYNLTPSGREVNEQVKLMHEFTMKVINERKKEVLEQLDVAQEVQEVEGMKKRTPFLNLLLQRHLKEKDITINDIREEVDTFMFEGHDTTAMGISWALFLIASNPDAQQKVIAELNEIFGGDTERYATMEDLSKMKYLECCIKESQRLYPSVPLIGRILAEDVRFGKSLIPAGTNVLIYIYGLHRDPKTFPDPERFDPERFLPENCEGRHPYAYVPFSAGPRNCIGQKFALNEEKVVLSWVFRKVQLESLVKKSDLVVIGELVTRSATQIMLRAKS